MTLQNLLAIHRLQTHQTDAVAIRKLLEAARRNLADAQHLSLIHISEPTRPY